MSEDIHSKVCSKCGTRHTLSEFYADKRYKDGLLPYCKDCCRVINRSNRQLKRTEAKHISDKLNDLTLASTNEEAVLLGVNIIEYALDSFKSTFVEFLISNIELSAEDKRTLVKQTKEQIDTFKKDLHEMSAVL